MNTGPVVMVAAPVMPTLSLDDVARDRFGIERIFDWQREAVEAVLSPAGRAVVIAPTGGGKSLCYQLPACVLPGIALVVSPLIALMEDQVTSLERRGIAATFLASSLSAAERSARLTRIRKGEVQLVYVAPERLGVGLFDLIPEGRLSLLAIDEAHCIVQWGHDFRPDYLRLGDLVRRAPPARLLACTATATPETRQEILRALGLSEPRTKVVLRGFARPNLALEVEHVTGPGDSLRAVTSALEAAVGDPRAPRGAGIVYAATRKQTDAISGTLRERGWRAQPYHAGMDGEVRTRVARSFADHDLDIVVATNAFGMGIDRGDVRVVAHAQPPASIEAYYQEVGRAGRDGEPAQGLLCLAPADISLRRRLIENGSDGGPADPEAVQRAWSLFRDLLRYVDAWSCRHDFILRYFGDDEESLGGCGRCDVCRARETEREADPEALARETEVVRKALAGVARAARRGGMIAIAEMLRGTATERVARFGFDRLSTFGLLPDRTQDEVMGTLRATVAAGYVDVTTGDFPLPYLTDLGGRVMRAQTPVAMRLPRAPQVAGKRKRPVRAAGASRREPAAAPSDQDAARRFEALRVVRGKLAKESAMPAYVIAHDRALLAAAESNPRSHDELEACSGWGKAKVLRYGDDILAALAELDR